MTLREALGEYLVKGQQGQLVIKFSSDVHLCKILIEDGKAVHITQGRTDPESILQSLPNRTLEWVNFIAGYPVRKQLDMPLHEKLLGAISGQSRTAVAVTAAPAQTSAAEKPAPAPPAPTASGPSVPAEKVAETIAALTEMIGPMGSFLAEQVSDSFGYSSGAPMAQSIYNKFVSALAEEIPKDVQASFLNKYQI